MFLLWIPMQFSNGVMEFITSVRNVTYKIIGFVKAEISFLNFIRVSLIGDYSGVFCFDSLIRKHKLSKLYY